MRYTLIIAMLLALCGCRSQEDTYTTVRDSAHYEELYTGFSELRGRVLTDKDVEIRIDDLSAPDSAGVQVITATKVVKVKAREKQQAAATVVDTITSETYEQRNREAVVDVPAKHPPDADNRMFWLIAAMLAVFAFTIYKQK